MEWCIRRGLDGVITDDPAKYRDVCAKFDEKKRAPWFLPISLRGLWDVCGTWIWIAVVFRLYKKRFLPVASKELITTGGGK